MPIAAQGFRFKQLCDPFVQPWRTTSRGNLVNEGMRQLVLQHPRQVGRHGTEATDWNPQLAIVESSRPRRRTRHIEESLFGIKRYKNIVARGTAEIARQVVVIGLERSQNLTPERFGSLFPLVMHHEMTALALCE